MGGLQKEGWILPTKWPIIQWRLVCLYTSKREEASCCYLENREHKGTFGKLPCSFNTASHTLSTEHLNPIYRGEVLKAWKWNILGGFGGVRVTTQWTFGSLFLWIPEPMANRIKGDPMSINTYCICVVLCCVSDVLYCDSVMQIAIIRLYPSPLVSQEATSHFYTV